MSDTPKTDAFAAALHHLNLATFRALKATPVEALAARFHESLRFEELRRLEWEPENLERAWRARFPGIYGEGKR